MATTNKQPPSTELCAPRDLPRSKDAEAQRQPVLEKKLKIETALAQCKSALPPFNANAQPPSPDVIWMAKARWPELEKDYALVQAELADADRKVEAALALDREEMRRRFAERKQQILSELWQALEAARPANARLSQLEELEHQLCGSYLDPLAWPQLLPSTRERSSFFDEWVTRISGKPMPGVWSESAVLMNDE